MRLVSVGVVLTAAVALSQPLLAASGQATWGTDGRLVVTANGRTLTTATASIFGPNWAGHDASVGGASADSAQRQLKITLGEVVVPVTASAQTTADGIALKYTFDPPSPSPVNAVYVGWSLPVSVWAGGSWRSGDAGGQMPMTLNQPGIWAAKASELTVTSATGERLTWRTAAPVDFLLQDNRQWGGNDFVVRVNGLSGQGVNLAAPVDIAVNLVSDPPLEFVVDEPVTLAAGPDWVPLTPIPDVQPGSALDFRPLGLLDPPAGKHGWVQAAGDRLEFANRPGAPFKIYGVNFCFSALYPEHELADKVADRLAMSGYNSVRIHHYESSLVQRDRADSLTLIPEQMDKLDYFIDALAKRGIYVTTDLFVSRPIQPAETVEGGQEMDQYKLAVLVSATARDNLKAWARVFLGHRNPYRQAALANDPVLCSLSLVNEGAAGNFLGSIEGEVRRLFNERWNHWLVARYGDRAALATAWGDQLEDGWDPLAGTVDLPREMNGRRGNDLAVFLSDLHQEFYADMADFLRTELQCPALLTDINAWTENWPNQVLRHRFDYVDNHAYWDHPNFIERSWQLPSRGWSGGQSATTSADPLHRGKAITQLLDRPFGFSEFNYANPNAYRAESGPLTGAYAALQGWDAVWRFAYSHDINNLREARASNYFDLGTDPNLMASDRFAALMFLRDVSPAAHTVAVTADASAIMAAEGRPLGLGGLGAISLVTRLGSRLDDSEPEAGELRLPLGGPLDPLAVDAEAKVLERMRELGWLEGNETDPQRRLYVSDTGQIRLDAGAGTLTVNTPGTTAIFSANGAAGQAGVLSIGPSAAAVGVYLASLTDQPVSSAERLLLAHVPDIQATGRRFAERARLTLIDWGGLPLLARNLTTDIAVALDNPAAYSVWAVGLDGARRGKVPIRAEDGKLVFTASTRHGDEAVLYYELIR